MNSGTGKAADFVKAAKQFKGKDEQIHATLLSIANALEPAKATEKKPQKASSDAEVAQREAAQAAQELAQRTEEDAAKAEQAKNDQASVDAKRRPTQRILKTSSLERARKMQ